MYCAPAPSVVPRRTFSPVTGSRSFARTRGLALRVVAGLLAGVVLGPPLTVSAQQAAPDEIRREILESQRRLEEIRAERARLQRDMDALRSRVRNVSGELQNIERQISATRSVLAEIDFQVEATGERTRTTTGDLLRTREQLRERNAVLNQRLRGIYKQGPLSPVRVLLGADSFTDLLNRYRYMQLMARHDRNLMAGVAQLERELVGQNRDLQESMAELGRLRQAQLGEVAELRQVEQDHVRTLAQFRSSERQTQTRLEQLQADEGRLTNLVGDLERRRIEAEARLAAAGRSAEAPPNTLTSADMGRLDWPVEGEILYRFGPERRPNGTILRWNGVGIRASPGSPVRSVRDGVVVLAGPFEGYGPTVIVSHGEGFYTLYLYLQEIGVVEGRSVRAGQVVGTVGGTDTPEGPHLEFQLRAPLGGGAPQAQDPLTWLRPRGN
ncbi:peptidoglycan DD-metalloendopeptidase family protein [soil metagenome]